MNIQEAKEEIKRTLRAYNCGGSGGVKGRIPVEKQRPVLLMGPPGIGKTAIMEQIAQEEQVGLVAYTMTHHTRQSAIGLPVLKEKTYGGKLYSVTEYTMSEIVASIYNCMEQTGQKTGILFIDEINCVSETLAPVMLQLLQNKTFGSHPIPEGWLIAGAGNPPEYNKSVREMDIVTLDRVKYMSIEADLEIWQKYAAKKQVHGSVTTFLAVYPQYFYQVEQSHLERSFVTARGWEDLSCILYAYEDMGEEVTEALISQYVQHRMIAREFYLFYGLFHQYEQEYREHYPADTVKNKKRLREAGAGECMAVAAVLSVQIMAQAEEWLHDWHLRERVRQISEELLKEQKNVSIQGKIEKEIARRQKALSVKIDHDLIEVGEQMEEETLLRFLQEWGQEIQKAHGTDGKKPEQILKEKIHWQWKQEQVHRIHQGIRGAYELLEEASVRAAKLYFTASLTNHPAASHFLTEHPQEDFLRQSKELLMSRREEELRQKIENL